MRNIEIIKHCLDAYNKAVEETSSDYNYETCEVPVILHRGVCMYLTSQQRSAKVIRYYWIIRNCAPNSIYWCPISYFGLKFLKYRRDILEIEYNHHKKWGILARFIKPPSHEELYHNLMSE